MIANPVMDSPKYVTNYLHEVRVAMHYGQQLIILGEQVIQQHGSFRRVRRYIKGKHPELGPLQIGWSGGWETVWETNSIRPQHKFEVKECPPSSTSSPGLSSAA